MSRADYRETGLKALAEACRLLLGAVFVFSGTVKAVDPMGGAIKIGEYLSSFGMEWARPFEVPLAFNLSALEFMLGVCLLLGVYRRYTTFLTLLLMLFMTPLTLYLALFNPVSDCGCFGDAVTLTNWQTFGKNVVLLAAAVYLFIHNQRMFPCYTFHVYWFVALWAYLYAVGFAYRNYNHLPIVDFRPYKIGANLPALMSIPEGAPEDEYNYSFIYEKEGKRQEFSLDDAPTEDSTWTFVESRTELIRQGYVPPISGFAIYDNEGADVTGRLLSDPKPLFLLILPRVEEADDDRIDEINNVYDYSLENDLGFYGVSGSSAEEVAKWSDGTGAEYPILFADDVLLKTIVRSNPGLVLLREGTILMKWHYNDIPGEEELKEAIDNCLLGNPGRQAREDGRLITNLFSFAVPLSLVLVYDILKNRSRRKREKEGKDSGKPE